MWFGEPQPFPERESPTGLSVGTTKLENVIVWILLVRNDLLFTLPLTVSNLVSCGFVTHG